VFPLPPVGRNVKPVSFVASVLGESQLTKPSSLSLPPPKKSVVEEK